VTVPRMGQADSAGAGKAGRDEGVKVLVISRTRLHREGVTAMLGGNGATCVVGTAACTTDALADMPADSYQVVLFDLVTSQCTLGVRELLRERPDSRVIVLGVSEAGGDALSLTEEGVDACLSPDAQLSHLIEAIERVARGEKACQPRISALRINRKRARVKGQQRRWPGDLTARELEVLNLIERGLSNGKIAQQLYIEVPTVKNHVHSILEKLNVKSRALAAAWLRSQPG
jgi:two-component system, NarL family, nitrate/nitrite response regulator NarL